MNQKTLKKILKYDPETGIWTWLVENGNNNKFGNKAGTISYYGYRIITYKGKKYKSSRLAFLYMGYDIPKIVDHVNMIKDDDRWCNLRPATTQTNGANQKSRKNNYPKGVTWNKKRKKWISQITINNKLSYLGGFDCIAAASFAYQISADKAFGMYARPF